MRKRKPQDFQQANQLGRDLLDFSVASSSKSEKRKSNQSTAEEGCNPKGFGFFSEHFFTVTLYIDD